MLAIHIVHSLETNKAGPISSQTLVLSGHNLFIFKGKGTIYLYCTLTAWIMPTLCPFLSSRCHAGWAAVCGCGISSPYSIIFGTIIIVDDKTIALHKIEL